MDVNAQNKDGNTHLHCTLNCANNSGGTLEVVKFLVKKGANLMVKNNKGETPPDLVKRRFNKNVLGFFRNKMKS